MDDQILTTLALLELVNRAGHARPFAEFTALVGAECEHVVGSLVLCGLLLTVTRATGYDLQQLIDQERQRALHDEPGMA